MEWHCHARRYSVKFVLLSSLLISVAVPLYAQQGGPAVLPEGDGREVVAAACSQCHALRSTVLLRNGPAEWEKIVDRMVTNGAQFSSEEADIIVRYLSTQFGPGRNPIRTGPFPRQTAQSAETVVSLPAGAGKDLVETRCGTCHDLGWITHVRKTRSDWAVVTKNMLDRAPLQATPEQRLTIISYLATFFGIH